MAEKSLNISSGGGNALTASQARLRQHFGSVEEILSRRVPGLGIDVDWDVDPVVAGLVGNSFEIADRKRGRAAFVAPLCRIRKGLMGWLGFREEWVRGTSGAARGGRMTFRLSAMTIHVGPPNSREKTQMFRAEWQGAGAGMAGSGDATRRPGHPHWQVDVLESFGDYENEAQKLLLLLREEGETIARDFQPANLFPEEDGEMMAVRNSFSRLHFASAAAWWRPAPDNGHVHVPASLSEIESWLRATLDYTVAELSRL